MLIQRVGYLSYEYIDLHHIELKYRPGLSSVQCLVHGRNSKKWKSFTKAVSLELALGG